ncbi:MAG TPA: HAMP domain-containing protein [Sumerlaeia bacterium]|nr:HAMP domain-containing protein [Sumerlaeia bacterium]
MNGARVSGKRKRRRYLINKRFQFYLLGWVFLTAFAVLASYVCIVNVYFLTALSMETADPETAIWTKYIASPFSSVKGVLALGVCVAVLAWIVFRTTHTIAGPIYRFACVAKSVTAGDYDVPVIRLRKRDEFKELAGDLNDMIDSLRARRDKARGIARVLSEDLGTLARRLDEEPDKAGEGRDQAKECLARMQEACSELAELTK